jgi:hypothetical protein
LSGASYDIDRWLAGGVYCIALWGVSGSTDIPGT